MLTEGIDGLQRKVKKGKGLNKLLIDERQRRVKLLIDKIYAVPDGMGGNRRPFKVVVCVLLAESSLGGRVRDCSSWKTT